MRLCKFWDSFNETTLYTRPKPHWPSLLAIEKLFVAAIMVLRSNNGKFEFLLVPSRSLVLGESSKYCKVESALYEYVLCLFSVIKTSN